MSLTSPLRKVFVVGSILLCGCSSPESGMRKLRHSDVQGASLSEASPRNTAQNAEGWLDLDRVELAMKAQLESMSKSEKARLDHLDKMVKLQQRSDILIELSDPENVRIVNSKLANEFPKGKFPISDLQKHLSANNDHHLIDLVVVMVPGYFPSKEGGPSALDLVRKIAQVLRERGVRRCVVETISGVQFYRLDSAPSQ